MHYPHRGTVSSGFLRVVAAGASQLGVAPARVYKGLEVSEESLTDPTRRLPVALARQVSERAAHLTQRPDFGLHLGETLPQGAFGPFDSLLAQSRTMAEAFERLHSHIGMIANEGEVGVVVSDQAVRVLHLAKDGSPMLSQLLLGSITVRMRQRFGPHWSPISVSLMQPDSGCGSLLESWFGARVHFRQPVDALLFERRLLTRPFAPSCDDPDSEPAAVDELRLPAEPSGSFAELYRASVEAVLAGDASLDVLADELQVSSRTLQRRFRDYGTSHRAVVAHLRAQFAATQLEGERATQRTVGEQLGYATPSSFHRALRRWEAHQGSAISRRVQPRARH